MRLRAGSMRSMLAASLAIGLGVTAALAPSPASADTYLATEFMPTPGPHGPITVIGDSVLLGSALWGPTLVDRMTERGWGPIQFRAGVGNSTGYFNKGVTTAAYWIDQWRKQGWDPADVVVNIGANDSVSCPDAECAHRAITYLVDVIGAGHRIWWPKITGLTQNQVNWNIALDRLVAERPGTFFTWDWPTVMRDGGFNTRDFSHLDPAGYRRRSLMMAREITADLAVTNRTGADGPVPAPIGDPAEFLALVPSRVLDTRDGGAAALPAGGHVQVDLTDVVPPGTTAVAVNLTSDQSRSAGFLAGYPCDRAPNGASNVNHAAGAARGTLAIVPLSADGRLCVYTQAEGHVIVDLQGAFIPDPDDSVNGTRFTPLDPPQRLLDTRDTGQAGTLEIRVPDGSDAVAVNITAVGASAPGWLKAYACGTTPPVVSNVNYLTGDTVASAAFVPVSEAGTICIESLVATDVIVDITGVFRGDSGLRFVPTEPTRLLDTRSGLGGWGPIHAGGFAINIATVPPGAQAVTGTLTLVAPLRAGFLTAYPCGGTPPTSNVNGPADSVFANAVTVGVNPADGLCILALAATHTLFDITGWWIP